ncbi:MAG: VWA domain-containing protein [Bacteroidales bacterium]
MFRFANPDFLYLLLLLPAMVVLFVISSLRRKNALKKLGNPVLIDKLLPERSGIRPVIKFILLLTAVAAMTIALARPQFGSKLEEVKKQGIEVIIALDVSNSMLAEDIQPNRLDRAKQAISRLIDRLQNDRIGLIVFAGDAYTQVPITTDYVSAKMFLDAITPDIVPKQGTAIGSAIELGMRSFCPGEGKSKAMIIISDGENHEDDPVGAAEEAAKAGIVIYTIGIGTPDGVPIPITINGRRDYLKDRNGSVVITKLDEDILKKIAMATGGNYVRANNSNIGLEEIYSNIQKMTKQDLESTMYTEYNDQFQIFAGIALLLLVADFLVMSRKNRKFASIRLFRFKV